MFKRIHIASHEITQLKRKLVEFSRKFQVSCILDSNSDHSAQISSLYQKKYDLIAGFSFSGTDKSTICTIPDLKKLSHNNNKWFLGYLSYDVKNEVEDLHSDNQDMLLWPQLYFFVPEILIILIGNELSIELNSKTCKTVDVIHELFNLETHPPESKPVKFSHRISKQEYLSRFAEIKKHIHKGKIYEMNFCQEFYSYTDFNPYAAFNSLNKYTPAPFAAFFKLRDNFLLSASPERFLKKEQSSILSQPIKGTAPRGLTAHEDEVLIKQLRANKKEQSENIMIVDLVRNDLSRIAAKRSVKVEELCEIYTFPHVHQMISTVSATLKSCSFWEIIKATFPMGSMTGAPKYEAMKLIEQFENVKRGLYSGCVGYINPEGDFDFSVVIRSMQYNAKIKYLSYIAGSAITALADPEKEYEECLLKAYAINNLFQKSKYA